jgi:hypothetical protein
LNKYCKVTKIKFSAALWDWLLTVVASMMMATSVKIIALTNSGKSTVMEEKEVLS